jgi:LysM repeat protein
MRRVIMTAAGLSVAAGLAACGTSTPSHALLAPDSAVSASAPAAAPATALPGQMVAAEPLVGVDLDWPVTTLRPEAATDGAVPEKPAAATSVPAAAAGAAAASDAAEPPAEPAEPAVDTQPAIPAEAAPAAAGSTADAVPNAATAPTRLPPSTELTTERDAAAETADVIVRPGDSLWSIATENLPSGATTAQIDAAWREWYRANRDVIGDDPNLIRPGQHLKATPHAVPTPHATSAPDAAAPTSTR